MKKLIISFTIALCIFSIVHSGMAQGCLPEGITFTTQEQIDNFQANYPGCNEIEGEVIISGPGITNLQGLSVLTQVDSNLIIIKNDQLTNLSGLDALTYVGGYLEIGDVGDEGNPALTSLTGLEGLTSTGHGLTIRFNPALTSFDGLENLTSLGSDGFLLIQVNDALTDLTALSNLTTVGGSLRVESNNSLTSLAGLENIDPGTVGNLFITRNPMLTSCEVQSICDYLANPTGIVFILDNAPGCEHPADIAVACGTTFDCLPYGYYHFYSQSYIDNFHLGFPNCTVLNDYAIIHSENINNLNGLSQVRTVEGDLWIEGNPLLTSLAGLESLDSITGDLRIGLAFLGGNSSLASMSALSSLDYIGGELEISSNATLTSLQGLENLVIDSLDGIIIQNNILLTTCEVQSICDALGNPIIPVQISGNAPGCNSVQEVEEACESVGIDPSMVGGRQSAVSCYPNPTRWIVDFQLSITDFQRVTLKVFDMVGREMAVVLDEKLPAGEHTVRWDAGRLPAGVYNCRLSIVDCQFSTWCKLVKY